MIPFYHESERGGGESADGTGYFQLDSELSKHKFTETSNGRESMPSITVSPFWRTLSHEFKEKAANAIYQVFMENLADAEANFTSVEFKDSPRILFDARRQQIIDGQGERYRKLGEAPVVQFAPFIPFDPAHDSLNVTVEFEVGPQQIQTGGECVMWGWEGLARQLKDEIGKAATMPAEKIDVEFTTSDPNQRVTFRDGPPEYKILFT